MLKKERKGEVSDLVEVFLCEAQDAADGVNGVQAVSVWCMEIAQ